MTVILVMVILVKIVFTLVKILHYNKYLYLYIVSQMTESEIENDHFDLDHFDHVDQWALIVLQESKKCKEIWFENNF